MDKLHAEMERTVSKTIDNKLVDYQISLSDNFYKKYEEADFSDLYDTMINDVSD